MGATLHLGFVASLFLHCFSAVHPLQPCTPYLNWLLATHIFFSWAGNQNNRTWLHPGSPPKKTQNASPDLLPSRSSSVCSGLQVRSRHDWGELCNEIKDHHILLDLQGRYFSHACAHTCARTMTTERMSVYIEKLLFCPKEFPSARGSNLRPYCARPTSVYIHEPFTCDELQQALITCFHIACSLCPMASRGGNDLRCPRLFVEGTKRLLQKKKVPARRWQACRCNGSNSQPSVCCLRLHFLSSDRVRLTAASSSRGTDILAPVFASRDAQSHLSCGKEDVITSICFCEDSSSSLRGGWWGVFPSFCMGKSRQCVHIAHCLTKASTCHRVNVMLALKGPGMYVCYGGGNWGGSPPFKQRRGKKKVSLGLCKLNRWFTLGAVLTLCLTRSVNSPSLWVKKETGHSAQRGDTVWLHDRLANPQSDTDLERAEHTALRALPSDTPLRISM